MLIVRARASLWVCQPALRSIFRGSGVPSTVVDAATAPVNSGAACAFSCPPAAATMAKEKVMPNKRSKEDMVRTEVHQSGKVGDNGAFVKERDRRRAPSFAE